MCNYISLVSDKSKRAPRNAKVDARLRLLFVETHVEHNIFAMKTRTYTQI